jgi:hypothetical protein
MCLLAFTVSAFAAEERVLTLPQDQGAWYLTIFGEAKDAKFQELQTWFKTNKGLIKLKSQVRFNKYTADHLRYQRYAENMPGLPCIRLQNELGIVASEFWGDNIPMSSASLLRGIKEDLQDKTSWGCLRKRKCPKPVKPPVEPPKPVEPPVEPPVGPPVFDEPEPEPEESQLWLLLVVIAALGGGGFGFAQEYKAEHMDKPGPSSSKL